MPELPERILSKIKTTDEGYDTPCWTWTGCDNGVGYGTAYFEHKRWYVHRLMYTVKRGEIPEGLELDHLCRVRHCCNPDHLEPVTRLENLMRSPFMGPDWGAGKRQRDKTHCAQGHEFTEENTRHHNGHRCCRACSRDQMKAKRRSMDGTTCPDKYHGTTTGYSNYRCRCALCAKAIKSYMETYRAKKKE